MPLTEAQIAYQYRAILRRTPSADELRLWTGPNGRDRSHDDLSDALLLQATEVRSIVRLYVGMFGGYPDGVDALGENGDGLTYWVAILRQVRTEGDGMAYKPALAETIQDWLAAPHYVERLGEANTVPERAARLYEMILDRPPSAAERARQIEPGPTAERKLAVDLGESGECKARLNGEIDTKLRRLAQIGPIDGALG